MSTFPVSDHCLYYNGSGEETNFSSLFSTKQICTSESSFSPSTINFSSSGSPMSPHECHSYQAEPRYSPDKTSGLLASDSCLSEAVNDFKHKLRELEDAMLGPDSDILGRYDGSFHSGTNKNSASMDSLSQMLETKDLRQVLIASAKAISDDDLFTAEWLMFELRQMVSVSGEPIQRLGAYMLEGLVARFTSTGTSIYKALRSKEPASADLYSYMHVLYEVCPYFKFGYESANGAIAEAMKDVNKVHIIDFQIGQGSQWLTLIQAFAARPGGPPHIRITGIDDTMSSYARGGGLDIVGRRLSELAKKVNVPFEFHAAAMSGCELKHEHLRIQPGEALAVNFAFVLHHMPDESVSTDNHRDRLLRLVKGLSPKVVTLVEQVSNTNTTPFFPRFLETLNYYTAMFESMDIALRREDRQRINIEQHCLARNVVNIIACEGAERVERHEPLGKWRLRFSMAGFTPYPLSSFVNKTIKELLVGYSKKYTLDERDGALYLGWMDTDLVASCAWK